MAIETVEHMMARVQEVLDASASTWVCHANGGGRGTEGIRIVRITGAVCGANWLAVFFDESDWEVLELGVIYADPGFLADVKAHLAATGLHVSSIGYSEQGAQCEERVEFDCDWVLLPRPALPGS